MTVDHWRASIQEVVGYFPQAHDDAIERFRVVDLYSDLNPPVLNQHGGAISPGFDLTMTSPVGTTFVGTTLIAEDAPVSAWVPTSEIYDGPSPGAAPLWTVVGFDDGDWLAGTSGSSDLKLVR